MTFSQIIYFQAVCKYQNVTLAANALFVSQPTISVAIRELEQEFNVRLFFRKNKQLILTKEGEYFLSQVNEILALRNNLNTNMRQFSDSHPVLRLGLTPILSIYFFNHFFLPFQDAYPNVQLEISEHSRDDIFSFLKNTTVDILLTFLDEKGKDGFELLPLLNTPLCYCVSKSHPFATLKSITFSMLEHEPLALIRPSGYVRKLIQPHFEKLNIQPNVIISASQYHIIRSYILQNYAGGFFPKAIVDDEPNIVCIPLEPHINLVIGLAWNKQKMIGNTIPLFEHFVKNTILSKNISSF